MLEDETMNKSCARCLEIYEMLHSHLIQHNEDFPNNDSVLNNILLNILSLMINKLQNLSSAQPFPGATDFSSNADSSSKKIEQQQTFLNNFQSTGVSTTQLPTIQPHQMRFHSDLPGICTSPKTTMQYTSENNVLNEPTDVDISKPQEKNDPLTSNLNFPFLLQPRYLQEDFIAPDGSLSAAGLSLLLGNQNKSNVIGKSDQLDVADILVNKMPIPSLNKCLDPNLLPLYLQQFGVDGGEIPDVFNLEEMGNDLPSDFPINYNSSQKEALQKLISRHKQISQLIATMNKRNLRKKKKSRSKENCSTKSASAKPNLNTVEPLTMTDTSPVVVSEQAAQFTNCIPLLQQNSEIENGESNTSEELHLEKILNIIKTQNKKSSVMTDPYNSINFVSAVPTKEALTSLQSLILETTKEVDDDKNIIKPPNLDALAQPTFISQTPSADLSPSNHTAKMLYKCEICNITFSVYSTLQSHIKNQHMAALKSCTFCQQTFENSTEYHKHLLTHRSEDNVFICQTCNKVFTSSSDFNKHSSVHTHRRPYACTHCQKTFRDPGSLKKHVRIHTGELPFVCQECNRGFSEKSSLKKHSRTHSGERPYSCNQCPKAFSISGNLQRHMFIHNGKRPFRCTHCPKTFNNPSHLRRHIKNLHFVKKDDKILQTNIKNDS